MKKMLSRLNAKKNNKGFTLVELIIVIAIIAVLAAVLAPQYIKYVENARIATDKDTAAAIEQAINVLCADGTIKSTDAAFTYTWNTTAGDITTGTHATDVTAITGAIGKAGSNTATTAATVVWTVTFNGSTPTVTVAPDYSAW